MPIESVPNLLAGFNLGAGFGAKIFAVLFVIFYVVFALILFRQIQLMDRSLPTQIAPFLKFISILQIGIGLAFLFVVIGAF